MIQQQFAVKAKQVLAPDDAVIGLAVGGSWLSSELDEYSDLDLILVTKEKVSDDRERMFGYARRLGDFLSGFTGEHVGEPRLLVCLYDNPLLHVDIKFVTLEEFGQRIETPVLLLDKDGQLEKILQATQPKFPYPDYQWIEDRFWTWVHYMLTKIGRGEYVEALDAFGFLRMVVFGPLLHVKNASLPRGVRKMETALTAEDLELLKETIPSYGKKSLLQSLRQAVALYRKLRAELFTDSVILLHETEKRVMQYFDDTENFR